MKPQDSKNRTRITRLNRSDSPQSSGAKPGYSYYKSNSSSSVKEKVKKQEGIEIGKFRMLPSVIAIIVLVGSLLFSTTLSSKPEVNLVKGQDFYYHNAEYYSDAAKEVIGDKLAYKTKFTINSNEVETKLLEKFPEVRSAVLRLPVLGRKPTLVLDIRPPSALLSTNSRTFIIDDNGRAISDLKGIDSKFVKDLPVIVDQSGLDIKIGDPVVTTDTIYFIKNLKLQLDEKNIKVNQYVLPASVSQVDLYIEGLKYRVKTDAVGDPRMQIGSFLATKQDLESKGEAPSEYIDVRVEEKAFYK